MKQFGPIAPMALPAPIDPNARYIFRLNKPVCDRDIEILRNTLRLAGLKDCVLVDCNIDIFALPPFDNALQQARVLGEI